MWIVVAFDLLGLLPMPKQPLITCVACQVVGYFEAPTSHDVIISPDLPQSDVAHVTRVWSETLQPQQDIPERRS